jgi:hypothetical protein
MSLTETDRVARLAEALHERVIGLAAARRAGGQPAYFSPAGERDASTYFEAVDVGVMQPADFEFPGGGTAPGLIDALVAFWTEQGETELAAMAPRLHDLARTIAEELEEGDGSVDILCYTMF